MQLSFHGAAREVTGSCIRLKTKGADGNIHRLLFDCGMFQGETLNESRNFEPFGFDPKILVVVSKKEFVRSETECIPLFIGCRAGIFPNYDQFKELSKRPREIAILWRMYLSGRVNGLGIHRLTFDSIKYDYILEKKIFFENKPLKNTKNKSMAQLTMARKLAAVTLRIAKTGEKYDVASVFA